MWTAAFSPDGKRIITASQDRTARIWDAATGKAIGEPLIGHSGTVRSAAFSPDGHRVVTASDDKTARIWDAATGELLSELIGHHDIVMSAAYSPDGRRIVTASEDETARLWSVLPEGLTLVSRVKTEIPRCFTLEQRKAFFLPNEPPAWCIEMAKWPYDRPEWKEWLADKRADKNPPLPAK